MFDIRRLKLADGKIQRGMFWHRWMYWLQHGGWFYVDARHPISTVKWWIRFAITIPKSRGWRWD